MKPTPSNTRSDVFSHGPKLSTISPYQRYVTGSNWSTSILKICSNWSIMCRLRRQLCRYQCETSGIRGGVWLALNWLHLHCSSICTTLAMYLHWYFYYSALALSGMQCNRGVDEIHGSFGKPLPAISLSYFISTFFFQPPFYCWKLKCLGWRPSSSNYLGTILHKIWFQVINVRLNNHLFD